MSGGNNSRDEDILRLLCADVLFKHNHSVTKEEKIAQNKWKNTSTEKIKAESTY